MPLPAWIAPSILAADFSRLGEEVRAVLAAGGDAIHFDVMDNHYVPNLTVGPLVLRSLRSSGVTAPMDVHLMTQPVDRLAADFVAAGASCVTIHPEATEHLHRSLGLIRDGGARVGVALNPGTSPAVLDPVLHLVDLVLVMSVNPGFGGQTFIPEALNAVRETRRRIDGQPREVRLQIDGGIHPGNVGAAREAGADAFVAGTAIFGQKDYGAAIAALRAAIG